MFFVKDQSSKLFYIKLSVIGCVALIAAFGFYGLTPERSRASVAGPVASHTGAPDEANCSSCHGGEPVNSGGGEIFVSGLPVNYRPGQQYPVTVTLNHFNAVLYGFQTTAIDRVGLGAGAFDIPTANPQQIQELFGKVGGNLRSYIEHTQDGTIPAAPNTKSWTFNWTAPATRKGRITFYSAGNAANGTGGPGGDFIYTGANSTYSGTPIASFDGDGISDLSVFRPSSATWYSLNSTDGGFNAASFGAAGDKIMPGDFDGDGKADRAIYRPSNSSWFILRSLDGGLAGTSFGTTNDVPLTGDFDGDGQTDFGVFRPSTGTWYIFLVGTGQLQVNVFGSSGDKPVPGDYDADGKADVAVYRPSNSTWYIVQSSNGAVQIANFGITGDRPVPADYDGDGKTDVAIFRPSNGVWFILKSSGGVGGNQFGISTDITTPGDYDGDGLSDIAVYRDGAWFILYSANNQVEVKFFGLAGDIPVAKGYIPE